MVAVPQHAMELMNALGPQTTAIDWIGFDSEAGVWSVALDDESAVLVEWFEEQECFMIQALLGSPPSHSKVEAYESVLAYNAMWRANGGAHIGIVDAAGELCLMVELPALNLTLDQLQQVLLGVNTHAMAWRRCVADPGGSTPTDVSDFPSLSHRV